MAAIDDLASAAQGIMMGDQAMLAQLQSMTAALGVNVQAAEVARQVPIASTLGIHNLAQAKYFNEPLTQAKNEEIRNRELLNERLEMGQEALRTTSKMMNITSQIALDAIESGDVQDAMKAAQIAKVWADNYNAISSKVEARSRKTAFETREPHIQGLAEAEVGHQTQKHLTGTSVGQIRTGPEASAIERLAATEVDRAEASVKYISTQIDSLATQQGLTTEQIALANNEVQRTTQGLAESKLISDRFIELYPNDPAAASQVLSQYHSARQGKEPNYYGITAGLMWQVLEGTDEEKKEALGHLRTFNNMRNSEIAIAEYARRTGIDINKLDSGARVAAMQLQRMQDTRDYNTAKVWGWYERDTFGDWVPLIGKDDYPKLIEAGDRTWANYSDRKKLNADYASTLTKLEREYGVGLASGLVVLSAKRSEAGLPGWVDPDTNEPISLTSNQRTLWNIINHSEPIYKALGSVDGEMPRVVSDAASMFSRYLTAAEFKEARNGLVAAIDKLRGPGKSGWIGEIRWSTLGANIDDDIKKRLDEIYPKPVKKRDHSESPFFPIF